MKLPKRGDVFLARLDPREGSEQAGSRPVIVVTRDAINQSSPVVVVVPCTDAPNKGRMYPSQVLIKSGEGGLTKDSVALGEQVRAISTTRLVKQLGALKPATLALIETALKITLDW